jgi:hypothetical protein
LTFTIGMVFTFSHEHRSPHFSSLVAPLLKEVAGAISLIFIVQGPPSQAAFVLSCVAFLPKSG